MTLQFRVRGSEFGIMRTLRDAPTLNPERRIRNLFG